jgi:hypothetical protein
MSASLERLAALADGPVWVAILRAKDQLGGAVFRAGRLEMLSPPDETTDPLVARAAPIARVVDPAGLPLVTVLGGDALSLWNGRVRAEFRSSMRVELDDRPIPPPLLHEAAGAPTFQRAMRELAAELEAGFRATLLMRPDPDPDASARARAGVLSTDARPLSDGSVRFAVGHSAATLFPDAENGGIRLTCIGSAIRWGRQIVENYVPAAGPQYPLDPGAVERLGADVRAFLCDRRDGFVRPPAADG